MIEAWISRLFLKVTIKIFVSFYYKLWNGEKLTARSRKFSEWDNMENQRRIKAKRSAKSPEITYRKSDKKWKVHECKWKESYNSDSSNCFQRSKTHMRNADQANRVGSSEYKRKAKLNENSQHSRAQIWFFTVRECIRLTQKCELRIRMPEVISFQGLNAC